MTQTVALLLGVHAHQPVGNFPEVLEDAHRRCYRPFIHTLHRYPDFKFAVHFSGWLLDYLLRHFPEDMELLREMVERGQVEVFGAGDTEPVLAVIPSADRLGQLNALSDKLDKKLGQRPRGAWLTERVWEATVVPSLADGGIKYVTVDDYHFLCAGQRGENLDGFFTTEEDGRSLDLFPISEALRYRLPFSPAHEAVGYIQGMARNDRHAAAVYFDDIEKFGIWPETYHWVYEQGWLTQFIEGVLASPVIRTMRYCDYHGNDRTRGVVYLPTVSYSEMNEWTLPAAEANAYGDLVQDEKNAGRFDRNKAFLRGGIWKNFFSRYPESNWMHKRMLSLSRRFHDLPAKSQTPAMREALYEAQANDAYWHGLFGGLYLPHLRRAIYNAIVRLEAMLDQASPRPIKSRLDLDLDGNDEVFLQNGSLQAVICQDGSASLCELDAYDLHHNFGDSLARQTEHYFRKIHLGETSPAHEGSGIASAHDRISFKHVILPEDLAADAFPRAIFRDGWVNHDVAPSIFMPHEAHSPAYLPEEGAEETVAGYLALIQQLKVHKQFRLTDNRLRVTYRFSGKVEGWFQTQLNLAMPSCDGPAGRYVLKGEIPCGFGQPLVVEQMQEISLVDDVLGGKLVIRANRPVSFSAAPHFTVSQSEAGFEKIMQAAAIVLQWPLDSHHKEISMELEITRPGS